ncbi:LrgB family protein [Aeribacillus pallidus]|uniref:LrgB family protein n=1 Tax=Aeribacillus pallidus TaxID=33936 RepID=UPI001E599641|nr:LrgB family protein [Aeribacillus pallidus]
MKIIVSILMILATVLIYWLMVKLYNNIHIPLLVPIATSTFVIISLLITFHISYHTYMYGGKWIDELLGPAVVALAFPLYKHRSTLKKYAVSIVLSVVVGTIIGLCSGIMMAVLFGIDKELILSLVPKSVTSPVAMDITDIIGGNPTLAAVYVMIAGIFGAMFGSYLLKLLRIHHPIAIGIGYGTASHGIGTARAAEYGSLEGAIGSISMTLSAIFASIICPYVVQLFL